MLSVALIQTTSGNDIAANIAAIEPMVRQAAGQGAALVALPENAFFMRGSDADSLPRHTVETHPGILAARAWAGELKLWLLAGSVGIAPPDAAEKRVFNRSVLISPQGQVAAQYDKIHLFDVEVGDGQTYRESERILPGDRAVTADLPWGRLGLTVCYDLRFPQLYRALAKAGASVIAVPSAFTQVTGEAHWHVLLRARAIENACFILAPAQCGTHAGGRKTYGHSLVVDPWGKILADGGDKPGVVMAALDLAAVERVRKNLPALRHDRAFK